MYARVDMDEYERMVEKLYFAKQLCEIIATTDIEDQLDEYTLNLVRKILEDK